MRWRYSSGAAASYRIWHPILKEPGRPPTERRYRSRYTGTLDGSDTWSSAGNSCGNGIILHRFRYSPVRSRGPHPEWRTTRASSLFLTRCPSLAPDLRFRSTLPAELHWLEIRQWFSESQPGGKTSPVLITLRLSLSATAAKLGSCARNFWLSFGVVSLLLVLALVTLPLAAGLPERSINEVVLPLWGRLTGHPKYLLI
jgi:hypothetical protein